MYKLVSDSCVGLNLTLTAVTVVALVAPRSTILQFLDSSDT